MSLQIIWSPRARYDLAVTIDYIRQHSPRGAETIRNLIRSSVERVSAYPLMHRDGRVSGTREAVVHANYLYVYTVRQETIEILRVLHARQRYP